MLPLWLVVFECLDRWPSSTLCFSAELVLGRVIAWLARLQLVSLRREGDSAALISLRTHSRLVRGLAVSGKRQVAMLVTD